MPAWARRIEKIAQQRREGLSDGLRARFRPRRLRPQQTDQGQSDQNPTREGRTRMRRTPTIAKRVSDDILR